MRFAETGGSFVRPEKENEKQDEDSGEDESQFPPGDGLAVLHRVSVANERIIW